VSKRFDGSSTLAVDGLNLEIERGSIVALIGPSGCGKTTTLRMINRLIEPTSGRIEIDGSNVIEQPVTELRRSLGYVIQQVGLFPHRTIEANIGTVPKMLGWGKGEIHDRVLELSDLVGLDRDMLGRYPSELSGGQQQRVGVARALAADPPVLLMDEPFGAVDPIVRGRLQNELLDLQEKVHKTIVLVTHDIDEAIRLADRIALMNEGGILEQYATPDDLLSHPANSFVAAFLGSERGLKRLGLRTVGELQLKDDLVIGPDVSAEDARSRMAAQHSDWLAVVHDDHLQGWISFADLTSTTTVTDLTPRPFVSVIRAEVTLREALDGIVLSDSGSAAVIDADGRFLGVLTVETLAEGLR
jgi:osmoprotectant transport system ATP-binding protein